MADTLGSSAGCAGGAPLLSRRRLLVGAGLGAAIAMLSTGCVSRAHPPADGPAESEIRVGLTEWTVSLPEVRASSGAVSLVVTNAGAADHRLVVRGAAGTWRSGRLSPGARSTLEVEAQADEVLALGCDLPGHEAHAPRAMLAVVRRQGAIARHGAVARMPDRG